MKYSLTTSGLLIAIALPILGSIGFSEQCANEVVQVALTLPGIAIAWYARVSKPDVNALGFKR